MRFANRFAALPARILARMGALILALCLAPFSLIPAAQAQQTGFEQVWLQIEARPTLSEASERAEAYAGLFAQTHGFRLPSGWYAIALGPYQTTDGAAALAALKTEGLIPYDSYVTDGREYRSQFWPEDTLPLLTMPAPDMLGAITEVPLAPQGQQTPDPATEPASEPQLQLQDETAAEARASESQLATSDKQDLQTALQWFGFYQGGIDGAFGAGTRNSMANWQNAFGLEPTGVLTRHQRSTLVANYQAEVAEFGFAAVEERESGINVTLPLALVEFDRYEPPFVHFRGKNGADLSIVLISQPGDQGTFNGLYDILQTLSDMPATGPRGITDTTFSLQGSSSSRQSQAWAQLDRGLIKGWMVVSTPANAARDARLIEVLQQSFRAVGDTALDPGLVALSDAARRGLVAGLEVKRPKHSRSGFYITSKGAVLTTAAAVESCGKITLDRQHEASIALLDAQSGLAVLTPAKPLAPAAVANFQTAPERIGLEVAVAGYSYEDRLPAPVLSWGTLEALTGLEGEPALKRLAIDSRPGDTGGPVLDASGSVIGMLLPAQDTSQRQLPAGTGFALSAASLSQLLQAKGIAVTAAEDSTLLAPETLTRRAEALTVLVSCWE